MPPRTTVPYEGIPAGLGAPAEEPEQRGERRGVGSRLLHRPEHAVTVLLVAVVPGGELQDRVDHGVVRCVGYSGTAREVPAVHERLRQADVRYHETGSGPEREREHLLQGAGAPERRRTA